MGTGNTRAGFQLFAPKVAFRRDGDATEELLVKVTQRPPVVGDEVGMDVFSVDHRAVSPGLLGSTTQLPAHNPLGVQPLAGTFQDWVTS